MPDGYGIVGVYVVGGNNPSLTVNNYGMANVWTYTPVAQVNIPDIGTFSARVIFNPPGLQNGQVTFTTSGVAWDFGSATNVLAVAIQGDPSGDTTWVVGYLPPPTATTVTAFTVNELVTTNWFVVRKLIGGKLTLKTNSTVVVTARYGFGIGNSDDLAVGVQGEKWGNGQYELFPVGPLWPVSVGMTVAGSDIVPQERSGRYLLVAYKADGSQAVIATVGYAPLPPSNTN
jgi:hypothetical protein